MHRPAPLGYILACLLAVLAAQPQAAPAAGEPSVEDLARALGARGASTAEYQQTRYLDMLDRPLESRGILRYRPPDYLVQEQTAPGHQILTLDGGQLILEAHGRQRRLSLAEHPEGAAIATSLRGVLNGRIDALRDDYEVVYQTLGDDQWGLKLLPRTKTLAERIDRIVVRGRFDEGVASVERLTIEQHNGNVNVMRITHRDTDS